MERGGEWLNYMYKDELFYGGGGGGGWIGKRILQDYFIRKGNRL